MNPDQVTCEIEATRLFLVRNDPEAQLNRLSHQLRSADPSAGGRGGQTLVEALRKFYGENRHWYYDCVTGVCYVNLGRDRRIGTLGARPETSDQASRGVDNDLTFMACAHASSARFVPFQISTYLARTIGSRESLSSTGSFA